MWYFFEKNGPEEQNSVDRHKSLQKINATGHITQTSHALSRNYYLFTHKLCGIIKEKKKSQISILL
jgi:hypothetical protein